MGIFDQPDQGSWLDRLLASVVPPSQNAATDNGSLYHPYDPQTGETIAPPAAASMSQPPQTNPLLKAAAALHSIANGGSMYGAVTGSFDDANSVKQHQQQQQYQGFINAGISPEQAQVMIQNPDAAKTIITQKFGPHSAENLGQGYIRDPMTGKVTRAYTPDKGAGLINAGGGNIYDPSTGKWLTAPTNSDASTIPGDLSKTGAEYLATLPPDVAGTAKAMIEGRQAPPSPYAQTKPYWQTRIQAAQQADPTFDQSGWSGRVAGVKDFSAGKSSEMVRSANQTLHHVNALLDSADALHNGNYPSLNWMGNKYNEATGGGEPGAFKVNAHAVADEMSKVFKGGNLSDAEIRAWEENLSPNMSPAQQRAQIGKLSELLHGSLQALEEKRVASMGQAAADKAGPIIKPEGQKVLQRIDAWLKAGSGTPAAGTAPTGVKWSVVQ